MSPIILIIKYIFKMTANKKLLIKDILSKSDRQFIIPIYQRNYKWESENCRDLLTDFNDCIVEKREYFIGPITYQKEQSDTAGLDRLYLVDGQQRITTVMLMAKALNLISKNEFENDSDANWVTNKTDEIIYVDRDDQSKGYKLVPTYSDNTVFNAIIKANTFDEIKENNLFDDNQILKNFKLIYNFLLDLIKKENKNIKEDIFINGLSKLSIVEIGLGIEENAQEIFESINNKGLKLKPFDCIRNYLLMSLNQDQLNNLFENKWKPIQDTFIGEKNMDDFIMHYLIMNIGNVVSKNDLYNEYISFAKEKHSLPNNQIDRVWLIDDLYESAKIYSVFLKWNDEYNKNVNNLLEEIRELGNTTIYPFLLRIFLARKNDPINLSENDLEKILNFIVVYIVRRTVCAIRTSGLRGFMASLYNHIFVEGLDVHSYYETICNYFINLNSSNVNYEHRIPRLNLFKRNLLTYQLYKETGNNPFCRYLLLKIENGRWPKPYGETVNSDTITIEHIIPQTPSESYDNEQFVKVYKEGYINTIGNLSLSSRQKNSAMSNDSFTLKKMILCSDDSKFKVLNSMLMNFDKFEEKELIDRANILIEKLIQEYRINEIDDYQENNKNDLDLLSTKPDNSEINLTNSLEIKHGNDIENNNLQKILLNGERLNVKDCSACSLTINGEEYKVSSWPDALLIICECCAKIDPDKIPQYFNNDENKISTQKNEKYPSRLIPNTKYYINVHGDANQLFNIISGLSKYFNLDAYIEIRKK